MNLNNCNKDLFQCVVEKATLKQEVYQKTLNSFSLFKESIHGLCNEYGKRFKPSKMKIPIPFEFRDRSEFEMELRFGGDVLIFMMHTNIFEFPRDHEVMKTSYLRNQPDLSYCGMILIYNFLSDSFRYNRVNDSGYLIGRVMLNNENHYFLEGKREIGLLYNNFSTNVLDRKAVDEIVRSAIKYTVQFDLLLPPYENVQEVTVQEMQEQLDYIALKTAKRMGFRFNRDHEAVENLL